jgi:DTW domain-containing protein YfiP
MLWVLDAKWGQVPQMLRRSTNLRGIPFVQFRPTLQSQFRVRRQPDRHCLSTIESIHYVIDRYCTLNGGNDRRHDALLDVFRYLVEQQIEFAASRPSHRHTHAQRLGDSTLSKA